MLTINKVFTFLSTLLVWVGIGNTALEAFKTNEQSRLTNECPTIFYSWPRQTEGKGKAFFEWKSINLSYVMNYLFILHVGLILTTIKVFIILFLVRTGNILAISKISKLCFQLSVHVYSLLIHLSPFFLLGG